MPEEKPFGEKLRIDLKVGFFLAKRDIRRANIWTTALIIFVMTLTFLNLVVVSGILVGLIEGSVEANKKVSTGDVIITPFLNRPFIDNTQWVASIAREVPGFEKMTIRYSGGGRVESNYKETVKRGDLRDGAGVQVLGIEPEVEENFSGISKFLIEGEYLTKEDSEWVMLGKNLLYKYTPIEAPGFQTLKDVKIGSKVQVTVGDIQKEYFVKGIIGSKVDAFDTSVVMTDTEARKILGRGDYNANQISVRLDSGSDPVLAKNSLIASGAGDYGRVQTSTEAEPKFLKDIKVTFAILGNAISSIGLVVGGITIFIVIFVNAITRRRFIGILKGIGISNRAISFSYVIQSLFFAGAGIIVGGILVFALIKPALDANPIDFPFSDGILVAKFGETSVRALILFLATAVAGYIPARIVVKQNTLSAILGR